MSKTKEIEIFETLTKIEPEGREDFLKLIFRIWNAKLPELEYNQEKLDSFAELIDEEGKLDQLLEFAKEKAERGDYDNVEEAEQEHK